MKFYIYTLSCPITGYVKYVGKTNSPQYRYNSHVSDFRDINKLKSWIISLKNKGLRPVMEILEECIGEDWRLSEEFWYWQFRSWGFKLKNMLHCGYGQSCVPDEVKRKIAKSLLGRKPPPLARQRTIVSVCQYDLSGNFIRIFASLEEAMLAVGIKNNIPSSIRREQSAGGFQWRYFNANCANAIPPYKRKVGDVKNANLARFRPVIEIDRNGSTINKFSSIVEAKAKTGLDNIGAVCLGARTHSRNRLFKFAIDANTLTTYNQNV